ncbi:uncharacterized protein LOC135370875 isoform X3 [Ornithodoros turicata]
MCLNTLFGLCILPAVLIAMAFFFISWNSKFTYFSELTQDPGETDADSRRSDHRIGTENTSSSTGGGQILRDAVSGRSVALAVEWATSVGGDVPRKSVAVGFYNGSAYLAGRTLHEQEPCLVVQEPRPLCFFLGRQTSFQPALRFQYLVETDGHIFTWEDPAQGRALHASLSDITFGRSTAAHMFLRGGLVHKSVLYTFEGSQVGLPHELLSKVSEAYPHERWRGTHRGMSLRDGVRAGRFAFVGRAVLP